MNNPTCFLCYSADKPFVLGGMRLCVDCDARIKQRELDDQLERERLEQVMRGDLELLEREQEEARVQRMRWSRNDDTLERRREREMDSGFSLGR